MKLTIRDLLWCALLMAACTLWFVQHRRAAQKIEEMWQHAVFHTAAAGSWERKYEQRRLAVVQKIAQLSDRELDARLSAIVMLQRPREEDDFEPCLAEMQRRGLTQELERHYQTYMNGESQWVIPQNLELLTALRRSQGRPDPLRIEISLAGPADNQKLAPPKLSAKLTNVDVEGQPLSFVDGGDYRGGRQEKWRLTLTDQWGRQVADSNFGSFGGGGIAGMGPLEPGTSSERDMSDLRRYVAPPPSGKYQLQAFFHGYKGIAGRRNLTGLIVAKSDPLPVTVHNLHDRKFEWFPVKVRPIFAILAAVAVLAAMSRFGSTSRRFTPPSTSAAKPTRWRRLAGLVPRDACWGALVVAAALGLWLDQRAQDAKIARLTPDSEAEWSITLDQDASPPHDRHKE